MKKTFFLLFFLSLFSNTFSQDNNIQAIFDSIITEGELLYRYEKSVWNSTDLLMEDNKLKQQYGGYLVSHLNDTILVTYIDKDQKGSIARYKYIADKFNQPHSLSLEYSPLDALEQELLDIKIKIINQLPDKKYSISFPEKFNPNLVLIKGENEFRFYILMGTAQSGIIPFGNDYFFRTDISGNIREWKKFHSVMIPAETKGPKGEIVISVIHSHLKSTPYITATDICTFRLYAGLSEIQEFMVASAATGQIYKYNLKTNKIQIVDQ